MSSQKSNSLPSTAAGRLEHKSPDASMDAALQEVTTNLSQISMVIDSLQNEADADRGAYIMKIMEENRIKQAECTKSHLRLAEERGNSKTTNGDKPVNLLSERMKEAIDMQNGVDVRSSSVILIGSGISIKNSVRPIILLKVEKLPRFTTWAFLDRNQRMTEDQSVVARRRIYYDQNGGTEALVCSDSEEEETDEEEDKKRFADSEDKIIRKIIEKLGQSDIVYDSLAQRLSRTPFEVKARYETLANKGNAVESSKSADTDFKVSSFLDKNLEATQDTFDSLFCCRCFIFDCKLHSCSQELVFPADKPTWNGINEEHVPCGLHCYLQVQKLEDNAGASLMQLQTEQNKESNSSPPKAKSLSTRRSRRKYSFISTLNQLLNGSNDTQKKNEFGDPNNIRQITDFESWRTLEKDLFKKGLDMFGRNSCLIARNLMGPLKTCVEVFHVLKNYENNPACQEGNTNSVDDGNKVESNENLGTTLRRRSILRRRNRVRRLKYSWKPAGHHSKRKRISDKKNLSCHQYNPCGCQSICGNDCSCFTNRITCEKYCGCPKSCKNRFRGCYCAKSQCRSRQCPCFAANRECDPDVCWNCWVSCGDGTLGCPDQKGENYECRNIKLLLRQQQRVLLGKSEVSGWGAFLKDSVAKHDYLGEYTGELISHHEADKRGKIYDLENSSFLFNLNDKYVLDAYWKGNKLKFANHSPNPNCYAKVMMVAGDHRVGINAKEKISAGEELFYDYRYEPDRAPAWAKKPEDSGSRQEDIASFSGRAKKIA